MPVGSEIAAPAALIGDPTRAVFLTQLRDGRSLPASELASQAGVTASTASIQLAKLVDGGLVNVEQHGRHRYYSLADPAVGAALETLKAIAPAAAKPRPNATADLTAARTCYDHLAGVAGVALFDALIRRGLLTDELELTANGARKLAKLGVDVDHAAGGRRPFVRTCVDWTERRSHLAGGLGAAIATRLFELGWIERRPSGRAVRITPKGRAGLARDFGVQLD